MTDDEFRNRAARPTRQHDPERELRAKVARLTAELEAMRALLASLREPTDAMRKAGIDACPICYHRVTPSGMKERHSLNTIEVAEIFVAMLDAALAQPGARQGERVDG